ALQRRGLQQVPVSQRAARPAQAGEIARAPHERDHLVPFGDELAHEESADESGSAGDQYPHASSFSSGVIPRARRSAITLQAAARRPTRPKPMSLPVASRFTSIPATKAASAAASCWMLPIKLRKLPRFL